MVLPLRPFHYFVVGLVIEMQRFLEKFRSDQTMKEYVAICKLVSNLLGPQKSKCDAGEPSCSKKTEEEESSKTPKRRRSSDESMEWSPISCTLNVSIREEFAEDLETELVNKVKVHFSGGGPIWIKRELDIWLDTKDLDCKDIGFGFSKIGCCIEQMCVPRTDKFLPFFETDDTTIHNDKTHLGSVLEPFTHLEKLDNLIESLGSRVYKEYHLQPTFDFKAESTFLCMDDLHQIYQKGELPFKYNNNEFIKVLNRIEYKSCQSKSICKTLNHSAVPVQYERKLRSVENVTFIPIYLNASLTQEAKDILNNQNHQSLAKLNLIQQGTMTLLSETRPHVRGMYIPLRRQILPFQLGKCLPQKGIAIVYRGLIVQHCETIGSSVLNYQRRYSAYVQFVGEEIPLDQMNDLNHWI